MLVEGFGGSRGNSENRMKIIILFIWPILNSLFSAYYFS